MWIHIPPEALPPLPSKNTREAQGRYRYAIMDTETGQYWVFMGSGELLVRKPDTFAPNERELRTICVEIQDNSCIPTTP
jgi:hypothetical protein